jgi:hypothetical protein
LRDLWCHGSNATLREEGTSTMLRCLQIEVKPMCMHRNPMIPMMPVCPDDSMPGMR